MASRKRKLFWLFVFFIVACYAQCVNQAYRFDPHYSVYADSTTMYFLQRLVDPALFHRDLLAAGFLKNFGFLNPGLGYFPLYSLLLSVFSLPVAMKIVSVLLCILSVVLVYRLLEQEFSFSYAVLFSGVFLVYFLSMDSFFGGLGRTFGVAIYLFFIYCLSQRRLLPASLSIFSACFLYLSIVPGMAMTYLLMIVYLKRDLFLRRTSWPSVVLAFLLCLVVGFALLKSPFFSHIVAHLKDVQMYKLYQGGWQPEAVGNPFVAITCYVLNLYEHSALYKGLTIAGVLISLLIVLTVKKWWDVPRVYWLMMSGALVSFLLLFHFHPTSASRQFVFVMPLFLIVFIGVNLYKVIPYREMFAEGACGVFLVFFLIVHPSLNDVESWRRYDPVYRHILGLPKDIMIAGSSKSGLLRSIPFFAKRPVYYFEETRDCWVMFFSLEFAKERRRGLVQVWYADSLKPIKDFIEKNKIDYFVVESKHFDVRGYGELFWTTSPDEEEVYSYIREKLVKKDFALLKFTALHYDFKSDIDGNTIYVISADKIRNAGESG